MNILPSSSVDIVVTHIECGCGEHEYSIVWLFLPRRMYGDRQSIAAAFLATIRETVDSRYSIIMRDGETIMLVMSRRLTHAEVTGIDWKDAALVAQLTLGNSREINLLVGHAESMAKHMSRIRPATAPEDATAQ